MSTHQTQFKSMAELEHAYHQGHLRKGVDYRVLETNTIFRLSVTRKGLAQTTIKE